MLRATSASVDTCRFTTANSNLAIVACGMRHLGDRCALVACSKPARKRSKGLFLFLYSEISSILFQDISLTPRTRGHTVEFFQSKTLKRAHHTLYPSWKIKNNS